MVKDKSKTKCRRKKYPRKSIIIFCQTFKDNNFLFLSYYFYFQKQEILQYQIFENSKTKKN
jgi:hypothetical protein